MPEISFLDRHTQQHITLHVSLEFTKMASNSFDFIIIGGGTAGSVLASRLQEGSPSLSILMIEAGPDVSSRADILDGTQWGLLLGTELDWDYKTEPQTHLNGRVLHNHAGKALGGSSAINAGRDLYIFHPMPGALRRWFRT